MARLILVVDDDDSVRDLLRLALEVEGHDVVGEVADGAAAVEATHSLHPDVIVLDMMMPGRDGADFLREMPPSDDRPCVVAYSASPTHLELAGRLGADATVLKTGDLQPLFDAIEAC
jgi:CheY-like chemotaxis protein